MEPIIVLYAVIISFVINILICPVMIKFLRILKFGQQIRNDGPKSHLKKSNTPTMGGIIFLISVVLTSSLFLKNNREGILILINMIGFGLIGFLDDFIKIIKKRSLGLRVYEKIILQVIMLAFFLFYKNAKFIVNIHIVDMFTFFYFKLFFILLIISSHFFIISISFTFIVNFLFSISIFPFTIVVSTLVPLTL